MSEYNEFELCCELGISPLELDQVESERVQKWLVFLSAKREAEKKNLETLRKEMKAHG